MNIIKQLTSSSKPRSQGPAGGRPGYMDEPERSAASARISSQPLIALSMAASSAAGALQAPVHLLPVPVALRLP